jgi:hypothetical protein
MSAVLNQVLAAEAEQMGLDARAHQLRREARREYQQAMAALAAKDVAGANRWLDRADVDAELSLALARRDAWTQQSQERAAALEEMQAETTAGERRP